MNVMEKLDRFLTRQQSAAPATRGQGFWLMPDTTPVVLTANQKLPVTMRIDFDYLITAIMGTSTGAYTLDIRDESGKAFMSNPIHSTLIVGSGSNPHFVNPFFVLRGGQTVVLEFTDLSGAGNTIYLAFETVRQIEPIHSPIGQVPQ